MTVPKLFFVRIAGNRWIVDASGGSEWRPICSSGRLSPDDVDDETVFVCVITAPIMNRY